MSSAASLPSPEPQPLSEMERVVDTFVAPSKTFTDIRRNANWIVPWLLMSIIGVAMVFVVDKKFGMEKVVENQLALQPKQAARLDQLAPEQRAASMQTAVKINRVVSYAIPIFLLVILAVTAAILMATFNFGFGAEVPFKQSMAVVMYASLPGIIKSLIAMLAIAVGGGEGFTFQNPIASNLSGLVDPNSHFLYSVATSLDVITIWMLVLTGIGFSCLTKVKRGACMGVVFGWWAVVVLAGSGIGAAFS